MLGKPQLYLKSAIASSFVRCASLLSRRDRFFLFVFFLLNFALVALEVLAVILVGALVATATRVIQSKEPSQNFLRLMELTPWQDSSAQMVVGILGAIVASLLIAKSGLSFYLAKRNFAFLSRREPLICETFATRVFWRPLDDINQFHASDYQYALTIGARSVLGGVLGGAILLTGEVILQLSLTVTLFLYSPALTVACASILFMIFVVLYRNQGSKANKLGIFSANVGVHILDEISNLTNSYRDIHVLNKKTETVQRIKKLKEDVADNEVQSQLLGFISKYVFDVAIVLLAILIGIFSFLTSDAVGGLSTIAIFIAAISRMAPSVLRVQQGLVSVRGSIGAAAKFFEILNFHSKTNSLKTDILSLEKSKSTSSIVDKNRIAVKVSNVSFAYRTRKKASIHNVNLVIPKGETWAFVGKSGSGKTTLVDLILGLNNPDIGRIELFGIDPNTAISSSLIRVGYVPQNVRLSHKSIIENVSYEEIDKSDLHRVKKCLKLVGLHSWIDKLPLGIYTLLGENGSQISGGQKQRLGIARALYHQPELLIMDEATSSLDAESEKAITDALMKLRRETTIIVVAHRLSTIRHSNSIVYFENGKVKAVGSFSELRSKVPAFNRQAALMGL